MKPIHKNITQKTVPAKLFKQTHSNLQRLQIMLVEEKKMTNPTLIQAADIAITEAVQRIERRRERRERATA